MRFTVSPGSGVKFRLLALFLLNEPGKAWNSIAYNTEKDKNSLNKSKLAKKKLLFKVHPKHRRSQILDKRVTRDEISRTQIFKN